MSKDSLMREIRDISLCVSVWFCVTCFVMGIVIGIPLFFASCNLEVTTFCPRYRLFTGTVYMIKINGVEYTEDNPPTFYRRLTTQLRYENDTTTYNTQTTDKTYERYDYRTTIYYATHNDDYTCRVISDKILSSSMDIGKNVTWYSFKSDPTVCEPETTVIRRWYVGFVLVLFAALGTLSIICFHCARKHRYVCSSYIVQV